MAPYFLELHLFIICSLSFPNGLGLHPCVPLRNRNCPTPAKEGTVPARPPPVRVQVVRAGASLEQVVGQDDRPTEPIIVARQQPVRNASTSE